MTTLNDRISPFEPTISGSVWRYRWLAVLVVAAFGFLGLLASGLQPVNEQWSATATLVIEDPVRSTLFERADQQAARYVNDQVAILGSTPVADEAQRLLGLATPPVLIEAADILEATEITQNANSNVIHVTFSAENEHAAISGANAITQAYQGVRRSEVARGFQASLDQLDASIDESDAEIASLQEEIDALRSDAVNRDQLDELFADAVDRLATLQARAAVTSSEGLPAIQQEIEILVQELQALQLALAVDSVPIGQDVLIQEQTKAIDRKSSLTARRDQIEVDLELLGSGVLIESPAIVAEPPGSPAYSRNVVLALLLGIPVAAAAAYILALRRRTFAGRREPEIVLDVPLLAEIPDFKDERLATELPVWDAPQSEGAEGFRFNAASLDLLAASIPRPQGAEATAGVSVAFVAADAESGKTITVANTGIAAASEGARVLVIDADFGDQKLSRMLSQRTTGRARLESVHPEVTIQSIDNPGPNGGLLHLLAQGGLPTRSASFFSSHDARGLLRGLEAIYDFVLVDVPPLLQVAYSSTLVSYSGGAVVIVPFGSRVTATEEVKNRVDLTETPIIGYVFNRAPLRRDLKGSAASVLRARAPLPAPPAPNDRSSEKQR